VSVQRVVEEVIAVAAPRIRRADPDGVAEGGRWIGAPGHGSVGRHSKHLGKIDIPSFVDRDSVG